LNNKESEKKILQYYYIFNIVLDVLRKSLEGNNKFKCTANQLIVAEAWGLYLTSLGQPKQKEDATYDDQRLEAMSAENSHFIH
jgi:hypothetical protein